MAHIYACMFAGLVGGFYAGLTNHGTGHFPEQKNLDVPLIYGDYSFAEGISILIEHAEYLMSILNLEDMKILILIVYGI